MIERVKTGVPGLDRLIAGGFVKGSANLVSGGTGTGKTTFCVQFLLEGLRNNEPCVYLTMEEDPRDIKEDMKIYGWDLDKYEKSNKLKIVYQNPFEVADISATLVEAIKSIRAKRAVIDPISLMGLYIKDEASMRKKFYQLTKMIKDAGVTSLITAEIPESMKSLTRDGVTEFVVDGIVVLTFLGLGEVSDRSVMVRKMRRTKHETDAYKLEIGNKGLTVKKVSL